MRKKIIVIYLPRFIIDPHCHGRDLKQAYKTRIKQVLLEAKRGNIRIVIFMPNTDLAIITMEVLLDYLSLIEEAKRELSIDCEQYVYFGVTDDNLDECEKALQHPSVVGLKIYPKKIGGGTVTTGSIGVAHFSNIKKAMILARKYNKVVAIHCDDPLIIEQQGNTINAEVTYLKKVLNIAREVPGVKIVICHVSCIPSARAILAAQREGIQVAMELMPQYLWFDKNGVNWNKDLDPIFYHCFNNLRAARHRMYLIKLLTRNNPLIFIASDSACHTESEKLEKGFGGIPSNQEMVAVIVTLARMLGLSHEQVGNLLSFNAANFLGISVPREFIQYELVEKADRNTYNNGKVVNPWEGSKLLFPVCIEK